MNGTQQYYGNPYAPYAVRQPYIYDDGRMDMGQVLQNIGNWIRTQRAKQQVINDYAPAQRYYNSAQYKQDLLQGYPSFEY